MGSWLKLVAADGHELSAYVGRPEGTPRGSLVVIQEIFGVNAHIQSIVDGFAKEGYVAIAPALFDRIQPGVALKYEGEDLQVAFELYRKLNPETAILDVATAFKQVESEGAGCGIVGYCYGGLMSWLSATRGPLHGFEPKACVGYYAGGIGSVAQEQPFCPVMLHFGANDDHIGTDQIEAVRIAHTDVDIFVYEGAGHGFNCDVRGSYDPQASALARQRTLAFFQKNIG
ncbi:MAG: dienelactone hydrolase family protein [Janthinobacterium lividum]